jgi:large subunit ribosomal protein L18Ae
LVVGRCRPEFHAHGKDRASPEPKIYKMRLFAPDGVTAKSKFWYYLRKLNKVKRAHGEILACTEVY